MSKTFLKIGLGLVLALGLAEAGSAAVTVPTKQLTGHVPKVVFSLTATGRVPSTNTIHLAIGLPLHNEEGVNALLGQIYDPASPNYQHFLSRTEFTDQFAPSQADYESVVSFAEANGLTVTARHGNRMLLEVSGPASNVERAFTVKLNNFKHPTENRVFFAPNVEPTVPASLPVIEIGGLNNYAKPHSNLHPRPNGLTNNSPVRLSGSGPQGGYVGDDFRNAYVPGTSLTGAGQKVALVQFDGYTSNDITAYENLTGRSAVSLTNILLNGFSGQPTGSGGEVEVSLDIEMVLSMAPGISQIMLYEGDPINFAPNVVLNQIAVDNAAKQISCSWGWGGGPSAVSDQIFKEMAVQGQTFCDACGDSDAFLPGQVDNPGYNGCPASSPYITVVGGTTLSTTGPGGAYVSEQIWNWGVENPGQGYDGVGSCGGTSSYYAIPSWQQGISMTNNGGSTTFRNVPDVTLTGDNVWVIADGSGSINGGTSCASPLWAAFMALANQQAVSNNLSSIGFLNPKIYALAKSASYNTVFNDVTNGNNTWSSSPTNFYAVRGFDLASGLGSPKGTNMINALAGTTNSGGTTPVAPVVISAPLPPWGNTLSVANGSNPNGAWFLFLQDDAQLNVGLINNGWSLALSAGASLGTPADKQISAPANTLMTYKGVTNIVIAVTNYGPVTATNVLVTDTLPDSGLTLLSVTPTNGVTYLGSSFQWSVGNLRTNQGATITVSFTNSAYGFFTNSPSVTSSTYDPNPADKFADTVFAVPSVAPQLGALLSGTGANAQFNLSITNVTGLTAVIQATTNLLSPNGWVNVYTSTTPFATNIDVLTNFPARFYRAVLQ